MDNDTKLEHLLDEYELLVSQRKPVSVEDLCRQCPELITDLKRAIDALEMVDRFIGSGTKPSPTAESGHRIQVSTIYRNLRFHARGGLGEIFIALDEILHREVALKSFQAFSSVDSAIHDRFLREAQLTANLEHPGIVPVYGIGCDQAGQPYYAMRFIRGETLDEALLRYHKEQDPLRAASVEFSRLLRAFLTVCHTVAYAHHRGVVHRDIKPANIMLGTFGETLLLDWGLGKSVAYCENANPSNEPLAQLTAGEKTQPGMVRGTVSYMSPEQADGRWGDVGPVSDVYALGATLFKLLTGAPPFFGDAVTLNDVINGKFPPPQRVKNGVPQALEAVCLKAMRTNPAERYASAAGLALDIERWLADEPVSAWRETWRERHRRWRKRNRSLLVVIGVAGSLGIASLAAGTIMLARKSSALQASVELQQQSNERANLNLYIAQSNLLETPQEAGDLPRMQNMLLRWLPTPGERDFREFEWYWRWGVCNGDPEAFRQLRIPCPEDHADGMPRTFSMDLSRLVLGTRSGVAFVDLKSGVLTKVNLNASPSALSISDDGSQLAVALPQGGALVFDAASGNKIAELATGEKVTALGNMIRGHLPISSDKGTCVFNVATGERIALDRSLSTGVLAIVDRTLASGEGPLLKLYDLTRGEPFCLRIGDEHKADVTGVAITSSMKRLASASADGTLKIWHGETIGLFTDERLRGSSREIALFDQTGWNSVATLRAGAGAVRFSPDGSTLGWCGQNIETAADRMRTIAVSIWKGSSSDRVYQDLERAAVESPDDFTKRINRIRACWGCYLRRNIEPRNGDELINRLERNLRDLKEMKQRGELYKSHESWIEDLERALQNETGSRGEMR